MRRRTNQINTDMSSSIDGGKAAPLVDVTLEVPHPDTPRIQEVRITIGHIICQLVEDELCP